MALILKREIIHCQEKKELFSLLDYILSFSAIGLPQYCLLALVLQWFVKSWVWFPSDRKTGVGIWVYHNIPYLQYTSACLCVLGAWVCIILPGCAPLNRKTTAMMSQWKVAVSIYPIIHHSADERSLTTELGWRQCCLEFELMMPFVFRPWYVWWNVWAATPFSQN